MSRPLLIIAASTAQIPNGEDAIPAYRRYDGPAFRALRAAGFPLLREGPDIRVVILSARHGLLSPWRRVWQHDETLTEDRAAALAATPVDEVRAEIFRPLTRRGRTFEVFPASEVYAFGGGRYREIVRAWEDGGAFDSVPGAVRYAGGTIGAQLGQFGSWLKAARERVRKEVVAA